jgi:hypothetical protein
VVTDDDVDVGSANTDLRHNFSLSGLYQLPFGDGPILGGWSVNAIFVAHSGYPLGMSMASNQSGTAFGNRPNRVCDGRLDDPTVRRWFDTSCFVAPPLFEFGNYEIGAVRGPTFFNTDFGIFKRTGIGGNRMVEFRVEVFNLFNKAHFSNPNDRVGNASFGRISSTRFPARQIQLGGRFLF